MIILATPGQRLQRHATRGLPVARTIPGPFQPWLTVAKRGWWLTWGGWMSDPHPRAANSSIDRLTFRPYCARLLTYVDAARTETGWTLPVPYSVLTFDRTTGSVWDRSQTAWWDRANGPAAFDDPGHGGLPFGSVTGSMLGEWREIPLALSTGGDVTPTGADLFRLATASEGPDHRTRNQWSNAFALPAEPGITTCRLDNLIPAGALHNLFVAGTVWRRDSRQPRGQSDGALANVWLDVAAWFFDVAPPCEGGD